MAKIKSSLDLAMERMIVSNYVQKVVSQDGIDYVEGGEYGGTVNSVKRDFIECWDNPNGKTEHKDVEFVDQIEKENFLKKRREVKNGINISNRMEGMKMVGSTTYHYDFIPEVNWHGSFSAYDGNSRINRAIAFGLSDKNVKVKAHVKKTRVDINLNTVNELNLLENQEVSNDMLNIYHNRVDNILTKNNILYFSGDINNINIKNLSNFREIWTNSSKTLRDLNKVTKKPLYHIPYGVDLNRYNQNVTSNINLDLGLNNFVFLTISKWKDRKGILSVLKSFISTFNSSDDVSLLIVARDVPKGQIGEDFRKITNSIRKNECDLPHVVVYEEMIPERSMPNLYSLCNVFILLSEFERNGLTLLEAGALGKPIITCENHASCDFLNQENCFLIQENQDVIEKSSRFMRLAYSNNDILKLKSNNIAKMMQNYDWSKCINLVYNRIGNNLGV